MGLATFVTGGTGFIGRKLVRSLNEQGETVHLLSRTSSDITGLPEEGVEIFRGDVTDRPSLHAPTCGCDKVFHVAGYAHNWARDPAVYYAVNVDGLKNVAEEALACGVGRLVFTSTCLTFGPSNGCVVDEQTPRKTNVFLTEYERTKYLAEVEAAKFAQRGLCILTVNPTRVYGPGRMTEGNSVARMIDRYLRGRFPVIPGRGTEMGNYVYVDDLVDGHLKAMARGRAGEKYILGGENISFDGFFQLLGRLTGRRPPRFHLPPRLAKLFARLEEWRAHVIGRYPLITPGWMETFLGDWAFSSGKAVSELGYTYRELREGLELTCNWLASGKPEPA
jgi:nucleoside-diphosphate-sugar epimerase